MKYYRLSDQYGNLSLAVETGENVLEDITSIEDDLDDISDLARTSALTGISIDDIVRTILDSGSAEKIKLDELIESSKSEGSLRIDIPLDPPEVWAAGVTYKNSEMERRRESDTPDVYSNVYNADRPEVFLKSTSDRCMGPFEEVGIREDSNWNVPEPELAFVLYRGDIIGYTIGNDMSSRQIEGDNPLYLPQAKFYDQSCSIGPCFVTTESVNDPQNLGVQCLIVRDTETVFEGTTSTSDMARTCLELADWLQRTNRVPEMTTVLTGTSIVPPPDFSLQPGDNVIITIDEIGTLEKSVIQV
ncbi:MAG: fumarylacetoacetate hydrolase family protein [Dehalococcoidia bacterium]|nr:fumarylacetoacetate hydrolase family protein [Dehalococcoidia bacterium]